MKSVEIIIEIRKQAAVIRALINHLASLPLVGSQQKPVIEEARLGFNTILAKNISELRKVCGDTEYFVLEKCDNQPAVDRSWGVSPKNVVKLIKDAATMMQRKITTLPGDDGADDIQLQIIDNLQDSLRNWRSCELGKLLNSFNMGVNNNG
jgi:hypothetical protein